eukprot:gene503-596_t
MPGGNKGLLLALVTCPCCDGEMHGMANAVAPVLAIAIIKPKPKSKEDGDEEQVEPHKHWLLEFVIVLLSSPITMQPAMMFFIPLSFYFFWRNLYFNIFWALYATYIFFDKSPYQGAHPFGLTCKYNILWNYAAAYYPIKISKTVDLDVTKKYIFGGYPHGVIGIGVGGTFGCDGSYLSHVLPGVNVRLAVLKACLRLPFCRELYLASGCVDASKESINYCLEKKISVAIVLGGAKEALWTRHHEGPMKVVADRKGFVKLAILNNADLVPVISFGEMEVFTEYFFARWPTITKVQRWLMSHLTFSMPLFVGRFSWFPMMPNRQEVNVAIGKPVSYSFDKDKDLDSQINDFHNLFLRGVKQLYDENKDRFGYGDRELILVTDSNRGWTVEDLNSLGQKSKPSKA